MNLLFELDPGDPVLPDVLLGIQTEALGERPLPQLPEAQAQRALPLYDLGLALLVGPDEVELDLADEAPHVLEGRQVEELQGRDRTVVASETQRRSEQGWKKDEHLKAAEYLFGLDLHWIVILARLEMQLE